MCKYPECTFVRREKDRRNILAELLEKTEIINQIIKPSYIRKKIRKRIKKPTNNTQPTVGQGILNTKQNKINPESQHRR
jgi:hypothetical protein